MTTIGYGDVPLISDKERTIAMMVMFLSSGIYGYTLNKISSIILDLGINFILFIYNNLRLKFIKLQKLNKNDGFIYEEKINSKKFKIRNKTIF